MRKQKAVYASFFPDLCVLPPDFRQYREFLKEQDRFTPAVSDAFDNYYRIREEWKKYDDIAYIAGALTGVSEEVKERYALASEILGKHHIFGYAPHLYGTDPVKHPNVTAEEVRDIDYLWAVVCADFHLNWLEPVSAGAGIEEGWAESYMTPTIYLAPEEMRVSRLPKGMINLEHTILYDSIDNALEQLDEFVSEMRSRRARYKKRHYSWKFVNVEHFFVWKKGYEPLSTGPGDFLALVVDTTHPLFGKIGTVEAYDQEYGTYLVDFPSSEFKDREEYKKCRVYSCDDISLTVKFFDGNMFDKENPEACKLRFIDLRQLKYGVKTKLLKGNPSAS